MGILCYVIHQKTRMSSVCYDAFRGMGYGRKLLQLAIDYARNILHAKRITLGVFCDNRPAFECYRSIGFSVIENDSYMIDGEEWQEYEMEYVVN